MPARVSDRASSSVSPSDATTHHWSDLQLEAYHDQRLDAGMSERLAADLLRDTSLRARLARLSRLDSLARVAMRSPAARDSTPLRAGARVRAAVLVAAVLALVAIGWLLRIVANPGSPRGDASGVAPPIAVAAPERSERLLPVPSPEPVVVRDDGAGWAPRVQVVLSVSRPALVGPPSPRPQPGSRPHPASKTPPLPPSASTEIDLLDRVIALGDSAAAFEILRDADPQTRDRALVHLGDTLRSAHVARAILDKLPDSDQLAACRMWASDPALRPVAFERLRDLSRRRDLDAGVRAVVRALGSESGLRSWINSYGLGAVDRAPAG
ncbi:MAG: hypothetical protein JNM07_00145 [Phycisphaerae bacterium]|nr:hypothetical protein [Phycisphaerae bacterium]